MGLCPNIKVGKIKWVFHQYDDDPFPSIPHGHSLDNKLRLNVDTGEIINKNGKIIGKVKPKELSELKKREDFIKFVELAKKYHNDKSQKKKRVAYAYPRINKKFEIELSIISI